MPYKKRDDLYEKSARGFEIAGYGFFCIAAALSIFLVLFVYWLISHPH